MREHVREPFANSRDDVMLTPSRLARIPGREPERTIHRRYCLKTPYGPKIGTRLKMRGRARPFGLWIMKQQNAESFRSISVPADRCCRLDESAPTSGN